MKVLFMGSSAIAVPSLADILSAGHEVVAVVTQPDKPAGRGLHCTRCPLADFAVSHDLNLYQPKSVKNEESLDYIRKLGADIIAVVAYGKILPRELFDMPKLGCVNVHPSLLPKYRGAAPINWAIANGDEYTGVCTMRITEELDAGNVLMVERVKILEDEDAPSLSARLGKIGAKLLVETFKNIEAGSAKETPQDSSQVTFAPLMSKEDGKINWAMSAREISARVRGFRPWPSTYTTLDGKLFKIHKARPVSENSEMAHGTLFCREGHPAVACGEGVLVLQEVQLEGRKSMTADEFIRGFRLEREVLLK